MTSFEHIHWGDEPIADEKLNNMCQNDEYLYEHSLQGLYEVLGTTRDTGLTFRAGYIKVPESKSMHHFFKYLYPKPFLPGTRPVVLLGKATEIRMRFFHAVRNLDGTAIPDHRGFELVCSQVSEQPGIITEFERDLWISYFAIAPNSP